MNTKHSILVVFVLFFELSLGQDAEEQGSATIRVDMKKNEFDEREQEWRNTMAWHASRHCKKGKDNCWATDKQIRYHDVIITNIMDATDNVEVVFYVRDRYDHSKAGMSGQQVRSFFFKYEADIESEFEKDMEFLLPGEEGMEPWLIAVIVICSVIGAALIIAVIVLAVKQNKYKKRKKQQEEIHSQLRDYDLKLNFSLSDGNRNPGYESDTEKPSTSSGTPNSFMPKQPDSEGHFCNLLTDDRREVEDEKPKDVKDGDEISERL